MSVVYHQRARAEIVPWSDRLELAKVVANTDFVPGSLRGNPAAICAAILYGDEVGLGPMQSLAQIAVIDGKPTLSAESQRALILAAGHEFTVEDSTISRVTVAGRRRDTDHTVRVTWTMDDAKRAGIAGRHAWRAYPRQMLLARATAELARAIFADAIGGLAATEELEVDPDTTPVAGSTLTAAEVPQTHKRRRSRVGSVTTSAPQPEPSEPEAPPLPGEDAPETSAVVDSGAGVDDSDNPPPSGPRSEVEGSEPTPGEAAMEAFIEDASAEATGDDRPLTTAMATRLNIHVGRLRDELGAVTTESLYYAVGTLRRQTPDEVIADVGGVDDDGVLRWRFLRDSLNRAEARQLREWFEAKEIQLSEQGGPPVPGDG